MGHVSGRFPGSDYDMVSFEAHRFAAVEALRRRARRDDRIRAQLRAIDEAIEAGIRMLPHEEQKELLDALHEKQAAERGER